MCGPWAVTLPTMVMFRTPVVVLCALYVRPANADGASSRKRIAGKRFMRVDGIIRAVLNRPFSRKSSHLGGSLGCDAKQVPAPDLSCCLVDDHGGVRF